MGLDWRIWGKRTCLCGSGAPEMGDLLDEIQWTESREVKSTVS